MLGKFSYLFRVEFLFLRWCRLVYGDLFFGSIRSLVVRLVGCGFLFCFRVSVLELGLSEI